LQPKRRSRPAPKIKTNFRKSASCLTSVVKIHGPPQVSGRMTFPSPASLGFDGAGGTRRTKGARLEGELPTAPFREILSPSDLAVAGGPEICPLLFRHSGRCLSRPWRRVFARRLSHQGSRELGQERVKRTAKIADARGRDLGGMSKKSDQCRARGARCWPALGFPAAMSGAFVAAAPKARYRSRSLPRS
jgi:hypothetical protein